MIETDGPQSGQHGPPLLRQSAVEGPAFKPFIFDFLRGPLVHERSASPTFSTASLEDLLNSLGQLARMPEIDAFRSQSPAAKHMKSQLTFGV